MKTLKKTLCLVLAVVMVVGVLILPAHAADDYTAAVTALQLYGVIQGKGDGLPHADDPVTRADMAAIVYRIMTGDTQNPTEANAAAATKYGNYANKFADIGEATWAKGYIGFCANQGVLKGDEKGNVKPNQQITGYEVQAMLLRALGYDKNNEYTGNDWTYFVLADATKTGISSGVTLDPTTKTPRGAVAQLTLNAATKADRVAPAVVPNVGYNSLGEKLIEVGTATTATDDWGVVTTTTPFTFTWPGTDVKKSYATPATVLDEFYTAKPECEIAAKAGFKTDKTIPVYTNGKKEAADAQIQPTDTVGTIGEQGRWTRVYADRIVCVDFYLATVGSVVKAVNDEKGHEIVPASETLYIYNDATTYAATSKFKGNTYADKTVLMVNVLGDVTGAIDEAKVKVLKELTPESVTVSAIRYADEQKKNEIGFIGGGNTYLYANTFGYNIAKLKDASIGGTYNVYTDGRNNVLGLTQASTSTKYGVIIDFDVERISAGKYCIVYDVLTESGTVQVKAINGSVPFATETAAEEAGAKKLDQLVSYTSGTYATIAVINTHTNVQKELEQGQTTMTVAGNTYVFNDNTVFFIATYKLKNSRDGYVTDSYKVVKGFKNIDDLAATAENINGNPNDGTLAMHFTYGQDDNKCNVVTNVLVEKAVEYSTNDKKDVDNYAFLITGNGFVDVYDQYSSYTAILNGEAGKTLDVYYTATVANSGLYTYGDMKNGSWKDVVVSDKKIDGGKYIYKAGVLETTAATTDGQADDTYLTVANDVAVYLVNPTTGGSFKAGAYGDLPTLLGTNVYGKCTIWYQTDEYGFIDLIYIVANEIVTDPVETAAIAKMDLTFAKQPADGVPYTKAEDITLAFNGATTGKVASIELYYADASTGGQYVKITGAGTYTKGVSYKAVITVELKNPNWDSVYIGEDTVLEVTNMGSDINTRLGNLSLSVEFHVAG